VSIQQLALLCYVMSVIELDGSVLSVFSRNTLTLLTIFYFYIYNMIIAVLDGIYCCLFSVFLILDIPTCYNNSKNKVFSTPNTSIFIVDRSRLHVSTLIGPSSGLLFETSL